MRLGGKDENFLQAKVSGYNMVVSCTTGQYIALAVPLIYVIGGIQIYVLLLHYLEGNMREIFCSKVNIGPTEGRDNADPKS